ncbi:MAG: hypothetical protein BRC26_00155 [Nanohaloarchaea archaeon QH_8_44_6]|nr:MAG: hypothetical protein BRC26_00155 [Nanohaloarchaea archaeon QH_8_44_6]
MEENLYFVELEKTDIAEEDLERLQPEVRDTFKSKVEAIEKNLGIGATPQQAFDKRLSGNMHPILQMNLGRDYRAWFIEGGRINVEWMEDGKVYCVMVLTKREQQKLTPRIKDPVKFIQDRIQK